MEWKSSTDKEKYGNVVGEVIHHTLFEDGTITKYDVKLGNKTIMDSISWVKLRRLNSQNTFLILKKVLLLFRRAAIV